MMTLEEIEQEQTRLNKMKEQILINSLEKSIKAMNLASDERGNIISAEGYIFDLDGVFGVVDSITKTGFYSPIIVPIKDEFRKTKIRITVLEEE